MARQTALIARFTFTAGVGAPQTLLAPAESPLVAWATPTSRSPAARSPARPAHAEVQRGRHPESVALDGRRCTSLRHFMPLLRPAAQRLLKNQLHSVDSAAC
ncbi:MAG: hypothetical protein DCC58_04490 [Chloroflexi bacterium]|nr:MAG: hypothetical protein DCC58_04490 [Chloroflexota bacterium]